VRTPCSSVRTAYAPLAVIVTTRRLLRLWKAAGSWSGRFLSRLRALQRPLFLVQTDCNETPVSPGTRGTNFEPAAASLAL